MQIFAGILEVVFVIAILLLQAYYFIANIKKRKELESILPEDIDKHLSTFQNAEGVTQVSVDSVGSKLFSQEILQPINSYLEQNKGATDYHIIKDLTDRACDKIQDEVDSYNPVPLYLGLCGTMLGVILGIGFLWLSGGLDSLLASSDAVATISKTSASAGIQHLLGGVAIAMIASFVGVVLTIIGTHQTKRVVAINESGRNAFLSWIQCNLLPKMSSDVVSTLGVFYQNLNQFNGTFSRNSRELQKAFEAIKTAYAGQTEYTKELNKLDIVKAQMAFAALGSATDKINDLNEFLKGSSSYLSKVVALSDKLDTADERTKAIERMGQFFKDEIEQIKIRKSLLSESIGTIDLNLKNSLEGLQSSSKEHVGKLQTHLNQVYMGFQDAVAEQQKLLEKKLSESSLYLEQFKRLETIESQLSNLLTSEQFIEKEDSTIAKLDAHLGRLDRIEAAIGYLAEIVSKRPVLSGQTPVDQPFSGNTQQPPEIKVKVNPPVPHWLAYTTCFVLIAAALFSIVYPFLNRLLP